LASAVEATTVVVASAVEAATVVVTTAAGTVVSPSASSPSEQGGPRERALFSRLPTVAVVWLVVLVGVAGAGLAWHSRGNEDLFGYEQSLTLNRTPVRTLSGARVQAVVAQAPEPVAAARRTRAATVRCRPGGTGILRNPWSCVTRYRSGRRAHYRVIVQPNGYYTGTGTGIIEGCCVKVPTLQ
jgi:hypothetical protein